MKPEVKSNVEPEVKSNVKPEVKSNVKPEVVHRTKTEEKSRNILLSQESDIQEGHVLLRIPSLQSLDNDSDRKSGRKSSRKSNRKQDVKKNDSKPLSDEEIFQVQKGNFHKNYRKIMIEEISKFFFRVFSFNWPLIIIENYCIDKRHDAKSSDDRIIDLYSGKHLYSNVTYMKELHLTIWNKLPVGQH